MVFDDQQFEEQLKRDFLSEVGELLEDTESAFLTLEKDPTNAQLIDRIFRMVHTIKGSAAVAGFKGLSLFAHEYETLLNKVRVGEVPVTRELVDTLLRGVDTIKLFIVELAKNFDAIVDTKEVVDMIGLHLKPVQAKKTVGVTLDSQATKTKEDLDQETEDMDRIDALLHRPRRILVVDDDPDIRDFVAEVLSEIPGEVLKAGSGPEALDIWKSYAGGIDLLVSDQRMPGMDGTDMISSIRMLGSSVPVIFVSGGTERDDALKYIQLGVFAFFGKPIDDQGLIMAARQAIRMNEYQATAQEMSKLIMRSYLTFRKIITLLETKVGDHSSDPSLTRFSSFLRKVGLLVNRLNSSDF